MSNLFRPECAGASLKWHEKCPRCGAARSDNCGDDAAYEAQLKRRNKSEVNAVDDRFIKPDNDVLPDLVNIEGEDIVIRITPDALKFASEHGVLASFSKIKNDFRTVKVFDMEAWRNEVVAALRREAENGDTPVHLLLDDAIQWAVEQGPEGISIEGILP